MPEKTRQPHAPGLVVGHVLRNLMIDPWSWRGRFCPARGQVTNLRRSGRMGPWNRRAWPAIFGDAWRRPSSLSSRTVEEEEAEVVDCVDLGNPSTVVAMARTDPARTAAAASAQSRRRIYALGECTPLWKKKLVEAGSIADKARVEAVQDVVDWRYILVARDPAPCRRPPLRRCGSPDAQGDRGHLFFPSRLAAWRWTWQETNSSLCLQWQISKRRRPRDILG